MNAHSGPGGGGHGHHWMMLACCIPMVLIAVALVAAGAVSASFLVFAAVCVGAMFLMMRAMGASSGPDTRD